MNVNSLRAVVNAIINPPPPAEVSVDHLLLHGVTVLIFTVVLRLIHRTVLQPIDAKAQYFALHTWVNMVIVLCSIRDSYRLLLSPNRGVFCDGGCSNQIPNALTVALHLYHMMGLTHTVAVWTMKSIDLIHHIPALTAAVLNAVYPTGPIQNFTFLFIMGIPGGYDYGLLVGVKYGVVGKMVEKRANSMLNLWCRSPGLIISSFCVLQALLQHPDEFLSWIHIVVTVLVGLHNAWNAQYFMSRALASEVAHRLQETKEGTKSKPE